MHFKEPVAAESLCSGLASGSGKNGAFCSRPILKDKFRTYAHSTKLLCIFSLMWFVYACILGMHDGSFWLSIITRSL